MNPAFPAGFFSSGRCETVDVSGALPPRIRASPGFFKSEKGLARLWCAKLMP